jgi:hypothetical protein
MNIKLSTAKMILFKYRRRGWVTRLKRDRQMKNILRNTEVSMPNNITV